MISKLALTIVITLTITGAAVQSSTPEPAQSYGNAMVTAVHGLDKQARLYCDIADYPPLIGQNNPVCIKGTSNV